MDEQQHIQAIQNLCRVCGGPVKQNRPCKDHQEALQAVFSIDITNDSENIHPKRFCKRCYAVQSRYSLAATDGRVYLHSVVPVEWCVHTAVDCKVCDSVHSKLMRGGRPSKGKKGRG